MVRCILIFFISSLFIISEDIYSFQLTEDNPLISVIIQSSDGAQGSKELKVGIDPTASDGIDQHLGEAELPPMPPNGIYASRFRLPDSYISSWSDFRQGEGNLVGERTHTLYWQLGSNSDGLHLSWTLPEKMGIKIIDLFGGIVVNYSFGSGSNSIHITNSGITEVEITLTYDSVVGVEEEGAAPAGFDLKQNYPNPFNPATNINFSLPVKAKVTLEIFNALGQKVSTLANTDMEAGIHTVNFTASSLASGIYFYTLSAEGLDGSSFSNTKKMILMK